LAGRYGPYVTDGTTNASLPKGVSPEEVTWEQALAWLAARADRGGVPRKAASRRAKAPRKGRTPRGSS
jgi:DNA topoisomerase-1